MQTTVPTSTPETPSATPDRRRGMTTRPLRAGDVETLRAVFAQLSPRSVYQRYHSGVARLTPAMERHLSAVVPGRHEAIVAEQEGAPVGIARWIADPSTPGAVEVAVEVADAAQGRGIGRRLIREILDAARAAGARSAHAYVHPDNAATAAWARRHGAAGARKPGEPFRLRLVSGDGEKRVDRRTGGCGCMTGCRSRSSGRCASHATAARESAPVERDPATSSPSCSPDVVVPFPRTSSSTSSGARSRRA